jgi:hypothetical protein
MLVILIKLMEKAHAQIPSKLTNQSSNQEGTNTKKQ